MGADVGVDVGADVGAGVGAAFVGGNLGADTGADVGADVGAGVGAGAGASFVGADVGTDAGAVVGAALVADVLIFPSVDELPLSPTLTCRDEGRRWFIRRALPGRYSFGCTIGDWCRVFNTPVKFGQLECPCRRRLFR